MINIKNKYLRLKFKKEQIIRKFNKKTPLISSVSNVPKKYLSDFIILFKIIGFNGNEKIIKKIIIVIQ